MQPTRKGWVAVLTPVATLTLGVLFASPVVIAGGGALVAVVLALAVRFVLQLQAFQAALTVSRTVTPTPAYEQQPIQVQTRLDITNATASDVAQRLHTPVPLPADHRDGTSSTPVTGDSPVMTTVTLAFAVAGQYALPPTELECTDAYEWFTTTLQAGSETNVQVIPAAPDDITVGQGTERFAIGGEGEQEVRHGTGGIDPGELRRYQPGDPHARIDWKTTARLGDLFVREFEAATDVESLLLLDRRGTATADAVGRTQLDYLREVALWLVDRARTQDQLIGLVAVDEDGVTDHLPATAGTDHYRAVSRRVFDLTARDIQAPRGSQGYHAQPPADLDVLIDDGSAFATTLTPYLASTDAYVRQIEDDPLFGATRAELTRMSTNPRVIILATDAHRQELVETTKLATRRGAQTTLFIAPDALFGQRALIDSPAAYHDYVDFESFRRQLQGMENVIAYDIGPARQVNAVLRETNRSQR